MTSIPRAIALVLLAAAAPLAACSRGAYSERPLYSTADEAGAPAVREGLWLSETQGDKPCPVDAAKPAGQWPDCAAWTVVRGPSVATATISPGDEGKSEWIWTDAPFILAAGSPRIFQERAFGGRSHYDIAYDLKLDADGRIVGYARAPIQCNGIVEAAEAKATNKDDCLFDDRDSLILRAKKSLADPTDAVAHRWVRDVTDEDYRSIKEKPAPVEPATTEPAKSAAKPST